MLQDRDETILVKFEEALTQSALSSSTIVNYLADLRAFLRWGQSETGRDFSLGSVTQGHIRLYRDYLTHQLRRAASTVNRRLMALRKFFVFATELGFVPADPTLGVALVQDDGQALSRPLTGEEVERLLTAAQGGSRAGLIRRDLAILQLLVHTGLRVSEIVNLQKDDLIFDHPGVRIRVCSNLQGTDVRYLPISNPVCRALHDYLAVRPQASPAPQFFLSQEGRPISSRTVQRIITDCARNAALEGVSAQSLRRTYALRLFSETHDLALVSRRLGHQNVTITGQYLAVHEHPFNSNGNSNPEGG